MSKELGIPLRQLLQTLTPEEWTIYRAADKAEPGNGLIRYLTLVVSAIAKQPELADTLMPARYRSFTGALNLDAYELQAHRQAVASQFQAWAESFRTDNVKK